MSGNKLFKRNLMYVLQHRTMVRIAEGSLQQKNDVGGIHEFSIQFVQ